MAEFTHIIGPRQVHNVTTAQVYLLAQLRQIRATVQRGLQPEGTVPHVVTPAPKPYIGHRGWMLICSCNGGVSVSVEWDLACCFECGALYAGLEFPANREEIEALLLQRPERFRLWNPPAAVKNSPEPETVSSLVVENLKYGWPVPAAIVEEVAS